MTILTGGCQCGAVRFSCDSDKVAVVSICHCRMCQKAVGGYFAPFATLLPGALTWTRGERRRFRSSDHVSRAFCADCGTPLTYEADGCEPSIAAGAFDDPAALPPTVQYGVESELSFTAGLPSLPRHDTDEGFEGGIASPIVSHQHPDHDTSVWPLPKA